MFKKLMMLCVLGIAVASTLSACNTADGLGKDIENAGRSIQNTVNN
jgi:predicted small secreted protein